MVCSNVKRNRVAVVLVIQGVPTSCEFGKLSVSSGRLGGGQTSYVTFISYGVCLKNWFGQLDITL